MRIVPTTIVEPDRDVESILDDLQDLSGGFILKPIVGVGAFGTRRLTGPDDVARELTKERRTAAHIVQPFVKSIETEGEWSFVFGAGQFLYSVLKVPAPGDFRVQVMYGARTEPRVPSPEDLRAAQACFRALPAPAHLARIDMARLPNGSLALMEAELIEPQLFFFDVPAAAELVARATLQLTAGR